MSARQQVIRVLLGLIVVISSPTVTLPVNVTFNNPAANTKVFNNAWIGTNGTFA